MHPCAVCVPLSASLPPWPTRASFKDPNPCAISHRMFEMPFDWGIESPVSGLGGFWPLGQREIITQPLSFLRLCPL